jgi:hypothetical protein
MAAAPSILLGLSQILMQEVSLVLSFHSPYFSAPSEHFLFSAKRTISNFHSNFRRAHMDRFRMTAAPSILLESPQILAQDVRLFVKT